MKFKLIGENKKEIFGVEKLNIKPHSGEINNARMLAFNKTTHIIRSAGEPDLGHFEPYDKDFVPDIGRKRVLKYMEVCMYFPVLIHPNIDTAKHYKKKENKKTEEKIV